MSCPRNAQEWLVHITAISKTWWYKAAALSVDAVSTDDSALSGVGTDDVSGDSAGAAGAGAAAGSGAGSGGGSGSSAGRLPIELTPRWQLVDELLISYTNHTLDDTVRSLAHRVLLEINSTIGQRTPQPTTSYFQNCVQPRYMLLEYIASSFVSLKAVRATTYSLTIKLASWLSNERSNSRTRVDTGATPPLPAGHAAQGATAQPRRARHLAAELAALARLQLGRHRCDARERSASTAGRDVAPASQPTASVGALRCTVAMLRVAVGRHSLGLGHGVCETRQSRAAGRSRCRYVDLSSTGSLALSLSRMTWLPASNAMSYNLSRARRAFRCMVVCVQHTALTRTHSLSHSQYRARWKPP